MSETEWEAACHHTDTCALTGSAAFFMGIPKSHVLVNGPIWCYFYALRYLEDAAGDLSSHVTCTQPPGTAVIYGTEDDLLRGFQAIRAADTPERVFVENNCGISMIGDDIAGIAAQADLPWPVYAADSGGVKGGFAGGWAQGLALAVSEMKPQKRRPLAVNVLGATPFLLKGREDAAEIRRLLQAAGYEVISMPGAGSPWEDIMRAPAAALNLVIRDELALDAARASLAEEIDARHTHMRHIAMDRESLWGSLWFDCILVSALPSEAAGIAEAVRGEWADTGRLMVHLQHGAAVTVPAADEVLTAGRDDAAIGAAYERWEGGLVMASTHEESRLIRLGKPFLACPIAYPSANHLFLSDLPFCGVRGAEYLYERLWNVKLAETMRPFRHGRRE